MNIRAVALTIGACLLAFFGWWIFNLIDPGPPPPPREVRHNPDFWLENFTLWAMNEQGRPRYKLVADYQVHYPDDDSSELTRPHIEFYAEKGAPWVVDSERGWVSSGGKLVLLLGKVYINREKTKDNRAMAITTENLLVRPDDEYAETDKPVTIDSEGIFYESVGMRAYMKEDRLQLLADVRGRHEPKKKEADPNPADDADAAASGAGPVH